MESPDVFKDAQTSTAQKTPLKNLVRKLAMPATLMAALGLGGAGSCTEVAPEPQQAAGAASGGNNDLDCMPEVLNNPLSEPYNSQFGVNMATNGSDSLVIGSTTTFYHHKKTPSGYEIVENFKPVSPDFIPGLALNNLNSFVYPEGKLIPNGNFGILHFGQIGGDALTESTTWESPNKSQTSFNNLVRMNNRTLYFSDYNVNSNFWAVQEFGFDQNTQKWEFSKTIDLSKELSITDMAISHAPNNSTLIGLGTGYNDVGSAALVENGQVTQTFSTPIPDLNGLYSWSVAISPDGLQAAISQPGGGQNPGVVFVYVRKDTESHFDNLPNFTLTDGQNGTFGHDIGISKKGKDYITYVNDPKNRTLFAFNGSTQISSVNYKYDSFQEWGVNNLLVPSDSNTVFLANPDGYNAQLGSDKSKVNVFCTTPDGSFR